MQNSNSSKITSTSKSTSGPPYDTSKRAVCYHSNWAQYRRLPGAFLPENIDPFICTHLIYAFAKIGTNLTLAAIEWNDESTEWNVGNFQKFTDLKKTNPALKCLLSVGGSSAPWEQFNDIVSSAETRAIFIQNSVRFLRDRNFDGLDISWFNPVRGQESTENKQQFVRLLQVSDEHCTLCLFILHEFLEKGCIVCLFCFVFVCFCFVCFITCYTLFQ